MPKTNKDEITIPRDLARLLAAGPDDHKDITTYEQSQAVAKALLNILLNIK